MTASSAMPPPSPVATAYVVRRPSRSRFVALRGMETHLCEWGDARLAAPDRPLLVMAHGWMDIGASFQFVVDALADGRWIVAPDWRGFGLSRSPASDTYWFPDYLADLDALLDLLSPEQPVDLAGHSMGGNAAMLYAGIRPGRIRRLINMEGFGLPDSQPDDAPERYRQWLDELKKPISLSTYADEAGVADRLRRTNPRLPPSKAAWLAARWSRQGDDGRRHILGDPAHKRVNPVLYRKDEVLACWRRIAAPVLWIEADGTDLAAWWGRRYTREQFDQRLAEVPHVQRHRLAGCGHMLHHDQPEAVARLVDAFLA